MRTPPPLAHPATQSKSPQLTSNWTANLARRAAASWGTPGAMASGPCAAHSATSASASAHKAAASRAVLCSRSAWAGGGFASGWAGVEQRPESRPGSPRPPPKTRHPPLPGQPSSS